MEQRETGRLVLGRLKRAIAGLVPALARPPGTVSARERAEGCRAGNTTVQGEELATEEERRRHAASVLASSRPLRPLDGFRPSRKPESMRRECASRCDTLSACG